MAFVTIRIADQDGHERRPLLRDRSVVGRSSDCDLPIQHASISREHCVLLRKDGAWFVEDLGSANGTVVDQGKLTGAHPLAEREVIRIGKVRLTFHAGELDEVREQEKQRRRSSEPMQAASTEPGAPSEALRCTHCGVWLSIAHRSAEESLECPRCSHDNVVQVHA